MSTKPINPPAFARPASPVGAEDEYQPQNGATLRDVFAWHAMITFLDGDLPNGAKREDIYKLVAIAAYKMADAMLEERIK